jgi:hypothetical protein
MLDTLEYIELKSNEQQPASVALFTSTIGDNLRLSGR